ncbi:uncharacterized protein [Triticum aestivum]|uniref:uncharacterized protein n=1 Tax=Triticum aestivum TaxID=4565 RepID=UPI001D004D85|nr:uncharacterized protein LOC123055787 [Triticum aestivum]
MAGAVINTGLAATSVAAIQTHAAPKLLFADYQCICVATDALKSIAMDAALLLVVVIDLAGTSSSTVVVGCTTRVQAALNQPSYRAGHRAVGWTGALVAHTQSANRGTSQTLPLSTNPHSRHKSPSSSILPSRIPSPLRGGGDSSCGRAAAGVGGRCREADAVGPRRRQAWVAAEGRSGSEQRRACAGRRWRARGRARPARAVRERGAHGAARRGEQQLGGSSARGWRPEAAAGSRGRHGARRAEPTGGSGRGTCGRARARGAARAWPEAPRVVGGGSPSVLEPHARPSLCIASSSSPPGLSTASSHLNTGGMRVRAARERETGGDSWRQGLWRRQHWERQGRRRQWPLMERCLSCHQDASRMVMTSGRSVWPWSYERQRLLSPRLSSCLSSCLSSRSQLNLIGKRSAWQAFRFSVMLLDIKRG